MTGFWVLAVLAMVLVLGVLFRPFVWTRSGAAVSRRQINAAIFRDQTAQLARDRANDMLTQVDFEQARDELQRRVIDDTQQADATSTLKAPKRTMWALGMALPIAAIALYGLLGSPAALLPAATTSDTAQPPDMERLVAGLAKRLESEPDNLQGWAMLARSYKMLGRNQDAEQAFERAGAFLDTDAQLLAIYADLAATNAQGNFVGKPMQLIERALRVDPDNAMALWLAGSAAFRGNQFAAAIGIWERLIAKVEPGSEDAQMLQQSLAAAYAASGKKAPPAFATAPSQSPTQSPTNGNGAAVVAGAASVGGQVVLDDALRSKIGQGDTIMVIARAPGTRMPVAVLRANVSALPLSYTLDDSLAMSPQARISSLSEVAIEARISKSGMAQSEAGDLISDVQTVKVGVKGLRLLVNQVRP